jgi:hypothetical protein
VATSDPRDSAGDQEAGAGVCPPPRPSGLLLGKHERFVTAELNTIMRAARPRWGVDGLQSSALTRECAGMWVHEWMPCSGRTGWLVCWMGVPDKKHKWRAHNDMALLSPDKGECGRMHRGQVEGPGVVGVTSPNTSCPSARLTAPAEPAPLLPAAASALLFPASWEGVPRTLMSAAGGMASCAPASSSAAACTRECGGSKGACCMPTLSQAVSALLS